MKLKHSLVKAFAVACSISGCSGITSQQTNVMGEILAGGEKSPSENHIRAAGENCKNGHSGVDKSLLTGSISFTRCKGETAFYAMGGIGSKATPEVGLGFTMPISILGKPK